MKPMQETPKKRIYLANISLYITLLPFLFDFIYFIVAAQNPDNWGYIVLAFLLLPCVHVLSSLSGLVLGFVSRYRKENKKRAVVAIVLSLVQILFFGVTLFAMLLRSSTI